jgi:hypothetical protein
MPSVGMATLITVWDEAKRVANLEKHGVDFRAIRTFAWDCAVVVPDRRRDYGEVRLVAYAPIDGRLHAVVFTERGPVRPIISLRRANRREQAAFAGESTG